MKKLLFVLLLSLHFGCEHPYTIDEQQVPPQVVVDGLITDVSRIHQIKLTMSAGFYTNGATPVVSNADVQVKDSEGANYIFTEDPGNPGNYLSPEFAGVLGRTYTLTVVAQGKTYTAQESLLPVTPIDSLSYFLDEDEREYLQNHNDSDDLERYYEVQFYTKEPPEREDYYLFKFYRDGDLINGDGEDVYYSDDEFLQENISGVAFNDWYEIGEMAKMEMYSITREAFLYYKDLELALNNDGGLFSPLPSNPRTNLSNGALGYFQVSAVVTDSIKIE